MIFVKKLQITRKNFFLFLIDKFLFILNGIVRFLEAVLKNVFVSLLFFFLLLKGFFNSIPRHLFLIVFSNVIQLVIHIETIVSQQQLKLGYHTLTQSLNRSHTDSLIRSLIHTLSHLFTTANIYTLTHSNKHTFYTHTRTHTRSHPHTILLEILEISFSLLKISFNLLKTLKDFDSKSLRVAKSWLKINNIYSKSRTSYSPNICSICHTFFSR